jgi:hypothetical protein
MCKLISKCCVCGKTMGITTCAVNGVDTYEEKISHGYCSTACMAFVPVQVMFWDDKLGTFNLDQAYQVGQLYYFRGEELKRFLLRINHEAIVINYNDTSYNEEIVVHTENADHMNRVVKEEVKKWNLVAVLA